MIRLTRPSIDESDIQAVADVLRSGYLVQGPRVRRFEQQVAGYVGTTEAVAVSNGTAALHLGLLALGVAPGDRVAVPAYSWPATANVVVLCGAEPVFVDIDPETFCMEPPQLDRALEQCGGAAAVLPVHAFGGMADMVGIGEVAARHGVPVVEDAACALGATLNGIRAGRWGRVGCFSFHPRKSITTGEGGMIVTDDRELADRARALRNHGLDPCSAEPDFIVPGYNMRLTDLQGALGVTQMEKLDRVLARRRELARRYDKRFEDTPLRAPGVLRGSEHTYQSYVVRLPAECIARRAAIMRRLADRDIEVAIGTYHLPMATYFRRTLGSRPGRFPVTEAASESSVTLPLFEALSEDDQDFVVDSLLDVMEPE